MAWSYQRSFGLPVSIVRPFNTYGPRQSARAVIPTILSQLHNGATTLHLGALSPTRDFNYVKDTVAGFAALAGCPEAVGRVTNIGSGTEISIKDLVELCMSITGQKAEIVSDETRLRPDKSEVNRLLCDASSLRSMTDWKPAYSLEQGLRETSDWIRAHPGSFRAGIYQV